MDRETKEILFPRFIEVVEYNYLFPGGHKIKIHISVIKSFYNTTENCIYQVDDIYLHLVNQYKEKHKGLIDRGKIEINSNGFVYAKVKEPLTIRSFEKSLFDNKIKKLYFSNLSMEEFHKRCQFPVEWNKYLKAIQKIESKIENSRFDLLDL